MTDSDGGSAGGVEDDRPSWWQTVAEHQAEIVAGVWGEAITYLPGGGGPGRELRVLIDRPAPSSEGGMRTQHMRITLPLAVDGLTIVEAGFDRVDVPLVYGAALTRCRVLRVVTRDPSVWVLEVAA